MVTVTNNKVESHSIAILCLTEPQFEQTENPFNDTLRQSFQQQRQKQQRQSSSYRHKTMKFAKKYWKDVKVGDVLRIYNNDEVPADLVILATQ